MPRTSSFRATACAWASLHCEPCTTTVAPRDLRRSRMNSGVVSGTTTVVEAPRRCPA